VDRSGGSTMPVGLFGEHRNVTSVRGASITRRTSDRVEVKSAAPLALDHRGAGDPGDVGVQLVGRLEGRHRAARPGVGEQERLEHLVGAVGGEDLLGIDAVCSAIAAQRRGRAVGVAVPLDPETSAANASRHAAGGGVGDSLVLSRTRTSTWGEW
jgi:hypothetical protein